MPADGRLLKAATLEVDESALTGESVPVPKQIDSVAGADTPLGDRVDMVFMNTNATRGTAEFVVTSTGMATEVGHISGMLAETETEKTPLTKQLDTLTKQIITIAMGALAISLVIGYLRGNSLDILFLTGVAFAISAIPTGLPAVVTFLLATGTQTLAAAGAIVKRLRSVETLGATSAVNSDKTGTLTLNQMTAVEMAMVGQRFTITGEGYSTTGQITRVAGLPDVELDPYLMPMALAATRWRATADWWAIRPKARWWWPPGRHRRRGTTHNAFPRIAEVPFDAAYKLAATFHAMADEQGRDVIPLLRQGRTGSAPGPRRRRLLAADGTVKELDRCATASGIQLRREARSARHGAGPTRLRSRRIQSEQRRLPATDRQTDHAGAGRHRRSSAARGQGGNRPERPGMQVRMITGDHAVTAAAIAGQLASPAAPSAAPEWGAMSDNEADKNRRHRRHCTRHARA